MSSRFHRITRAAAISAMLALSSQVSAQSDDPEMRIQQLENQLRQLTGQNEELQYRNRQLEDRLRSLQGGAPAAPGGQAAVAQPNIAAAPPMQPNPAYRQPQPQPGYAQPQPGYEPQSAAQAPIVQEPPGAPQGIPQAQGRRRGDAFDPSQTPNAPGAPRALGGGQLPVPAEAPIGAPGGRGAGEPHSQYWLGESFFQRQLYRDAAESFLAVTTKFDKSAKAPDALLRLGQSLAALKEKEAACAALGEVTRKYPRASGGVKAAVDREQKRVKC